MKVLAIDDDGDWELRTVKQSEKQQDEQAMGDTYYVRGTGYFFPDKQDPWDIVEGPILDDSEKLKNELEVARQELVDLGKSHRELASHNYDLCRKLQENEGVINLQKSALEHETTRRKELGAEAKSFQAEFDEVILKLDRANEALVEAFEVIHDYREILKSANLTITVNHEGD
jgi:hypothetical protein